MADPIAPTVIVLRGGVVPALVTESVDEVYRLMFQWDELSNRWVKLTAHPDLGVVIVTINDIVTVSGAIPNGH